MGKPELTGDAPAVLRDSDARRICIIKPSALGDIVQTMPLLGALRARFPEARISWVVNRSYAPILEGHRALDERLIFDRRDAWLWPGSWWRFGRLLGELRARRFDLVFDLQGLSRTAIMAAATGAPLRIGMQTAREGAGWGCHYVLAGTQWQRPAYARYWRIAEALGVGDQSQSPLLPVEAAAREWAGQKLGALTRPVLAIHPGARWPTKRWPAEKFSEVAAHAIEAHGFSVVILGSGAETAQAATIAQALGARGHDRRVLNLAGQMTLKQLVAVLESVNALCTNDSGPMHMAAGLDTPVLAMFTCTSPTHSGPPGAAHELISTNVSCAASYEKRCPFAGQAHLACMTELVADRVKAGLDRLVRNHELVGNDNTADDAAPAHRAPAQAPRVGSATHDH